MILNVRLNKHGTLILFDLNGQRCAMDKDGDITMSHIQNPRYDFIDISLDDLKEIIKIHENRTETKN